MFNPEENFFDVKDVLPEECLRVLAYNNKLDKFFEAIFRNGRFYSDNQELNNITKWIGIKNNIEN